MKKPKKVPLVDVKITRAVAVDGKIVKPNTIMQDVTQQFAKNLMHRGRAVLAEGEPDADEKPLKSLTVPELKVIAADLKIEGADVLNKKDLIDMIEMTRDS